MILGIDQGTTGSTCLVFDADGRPRGRAYSEFRQHFPRPGWVEHDAQEIWDVTRRVAAEALADAGIGGPDLAGIGITNQRETAVAWDRESGEPLHRAIVWQDRRTAGRCDELRAQGHEPIFRERTGLVLDAYFSGTKYEWLLRHGGVDARAALGTIDSVAGLQAHRPARHRLLERLADAALQHPRAALGRGAVRAARGADRLAARADGQRRRLRRDDRVRRPRAGLRDGRRPAGGALRPGLPRAGLGKNTYGTGNFLLQHAGAGSPLLEQGLITTIAWGIGDRVDYALESSMFVTGAAVQWLRDGLGIIERADETEALAAAHRSTATTASTSSRR